MGSMAAADSDQGNTGAAHLLLYKVVEGRLPAVCVYVQVAAQCLAAMFTH